MVPDKREEVLSTPRCRLTTWLKADWRDFTALSGDPEVIRYIGDGRVWGEERVRSFVARQIAQQSEHGYSLWQIRPSTGSVLEGICGLQPVPGLHAVEIGWWLRPRLWGQGLATECARAVFAAATGRFRIERLIALIQPANAASRRVAAKLGMVPGDITTYHDREVVVYERAPGR